MKVTKIRLEKKKMSFFVLYVYDNETNKTKNVHTSYKQKIYRLSLPGIKVLAPARLLT